MQKTHSRHIIFNFHYLVVENNKKIRCNRMMQSLYELSTMKEAILPPGYKPSDKEPFMNDNQLIYFKGRLFQWRDELLRETTQTIHQLQDTSVLESDIVDVASNELDHAIELRTRDRDRKLLNKIEQAIKRIEDGSYGYCEETGEPISLKRLEARPIATLCIEAQERHERKEKSHKDD